MLGIIDLSLVSVSDCQICKQQTTTYRSAKACFFVCEEQDVALEDAVPVSHREGSSTLYVDAGFS